MERSTLIALEKHLYAVQLELDGLARLITKQLMQLSQVAGSVEHFRRMSFDLYQKRETLDRIPPRSYMKLRWITKTFSMKSLTTFRLPGHYAR